jgi:ribonuclease-3
MTERIRAYFNKRSLDSASLRKIRKIEKLTGIFVISPVYYLRALRHRSTLVENQLADTESYEQLEFLGDAVLDLAVTEIIFEYFPDQNEGFMTKLRSRLVREDTLAQLSRDLKLQDLLEVGNRVKDQGIQLKNSVLCDIFEAVIGAIYKDRGMSHATAFIKKVYDDHVDLIGISASHDNYKSILLEHTQAKKMSVPEYIVISESGPDHDKTFEIQVSVNGHRFGSGYGKNKKKAEQIAAMETMKMFKKQSI